ncbi:ATP-binding cassette domain-containing protein [Halomonas sp. I1]|uniref:ATP-binding cassette domain-containing protein n=1 Tax=Halomonas sp. I1 TaxID=393536 RepID=UPI0028DF03A4|nr:ATP-binding cassette domain-containing protein [Halomonas sp. I1]MDT8893881.1 ATP-binding cassette domain-containing protein [Halomonas sp. I1]
MLNLHHAGLIDTPSLSPLHGEVRAGELLAIVGPNGAGKTTLLTLLSGFRHSQLGPVTLDGWFLDAWTPAALAGRRALVAQFEPTGFDWRVRDLVVLSGDPGDAAVAEIMGQLELSRLAGRGVLSLSGGERQRVMVARALCQLAAAPRDDKARDGGLLLLDEPTSALDIGQQQRMMRLLRRLAAERHMAVVGVLHDLNLAATYADRVWLMAAGKRVAHGTPDQVLETERLALTYRAELQALERDGAAPWLALKP